MAALEDLKPNAAVRGPVPTSMVTVVSAQWYGSETVELTYKDPAGNAAPTPVRELLVEVVTKRDTQNSAHCSTSKAIQVGRSYWWRRAESRGEYSLRVTRPLRRPTCNNDEDIMPFKVHVGPPQIAIHQGQTVLVSEPDGQITWPSEKGLYFLDTRIVSNWAIYANGEPWELLNGGPVKCNAARIFLTNRSILTEDGIILPRTVGLTISRSINGGLHEDLDITNNSMKPVRFQLEIGLRCDFADVFEVKSGRIVRRGQITTEWSERRQRLRTAYSNRDFHRAVTTTVSRASSKAVSANGRLSFEVALQPREAWHACLLYTLEDGEQHLRAPHGCVGERHKSHHSGDNGGMVEDRGQDRDQQRGILPSLSPSAGGHGRAAFADQGH